MQHTQHSVWVRFRGPTSPRVYEKTAQVPHSPCLCAWQTSLVDCNMLSWSQIQPHSPIAQVLQGLPSMPRSAGAELACPPSL